MSLFLKSFLLLVALGFTVQEELSWPFLMKNAFFDVKMAVNGFYRF